jgi:transposase
MRGSTDHQVTVLALVDPDQLIPADHPIRRVKPIVEEPLRELEPIFARMYSEVGRRSIPPEHLLKGCLLMALYSIRSPAFDHSSFAKSRERLLEHEVSRAFFAAVLEQARRLQLLSREHFTVDGTLLESWASFKSLNPKPNSGRAAEAEEEPMTGSPGRRWRTQR